MSTTSCRFCAAALTTLTAASYRSQGFACKACVNRRAREYRERNRDQVRAWERAYRERNRDKVAAGVKRCKAAKPEYYQQYSKDHSHKTYWANPEKFRAAQRERYWSTPPEIRAAKQREAQRKYRESLPDGHLAARIRQSGGAGMYVPKHVIDLYRSLLRVKRELRSHK